MPELVQGGGQFESLGRADLNMAYVQEGPAPAQKMPIKACGLVPYPLNTAPSQRYRFEQWAPLLERQGITLKLLPSADLALMQMLYQAGRPVAKAA